jgi:hypothetical protein
VHTVNPKLKPLPAFTVTLSRLQGTYRAPASRGCGASLLVSFQRHDCVRACGADMPTHRSMPRQARDTCATDRTRVRRRRPWVSFGSTESAFDRTKDRKLVPVPLARTLQPADSDTEHVIVSLPESESTPRRQMAALLFASLA